MRRNDLDIQADLLKVANAGAGKTRLVYQANLNFKILKTYLARLLERGFIEQVEETTTYITTDEGRAFLDQYAQLQQLANPEAPTA